MRLFAGSICVVDVSHGKERPSMHMFFFLEPDIPATVNMSMMHACMPVPLSAVGTEAFFFRHARIPRGAVLSRCVSDVSPRAVLTAGRPSILQGASMNGKNRSHGVHVLFERFNIYPIVGDPQTLAPF